MLAAPFIILTLIFRCKYKKDTFSKQRFGFIPWTDRAQSIIWIHAASVGETLSLQYLIKKLESQDQNRRCYLTVGTEAAKQVALSFHDSRYLSYLPYDFFLPGILYAFNRIRPDAVIITEGEFWPNLIITSFLYNIPLHSLNSKMSERSYRYFSKIAQLFCALLSCFTSILPQNNIMKKRFLSFGLEKKKIYEIGNLKAFNVFEKQKESSKTSLPLPSPILLIGSVHPGEIDIYLKLYLMIRKYHSLTKLIIAPRHFHWQDKLEEKLVKAGISYSIWTNPNEKREIQLMKLNNNDALVVCVLGHLFYLYQYCTLFYLGGTFVPIGGHNLLEPAAWGISMLIGPYNANCLTEANELEEAGALIKTENYDDLYKETKNLLDNPEKIKLMQTSCNTWLTRVAHKVEKNVTEKLSSLL